jgi:putative ABC transport system permease protein
MKLRAPSVFGLSMSVPFVLFGWRLRTRLAQELLAIAGIAVGVALVFGVLVANTSIAGSASSLVHQLIGSAQLQLASRSDDGIPEQLTYRAEKLPGVWVASPLLRENTTIIGPRGSESIQLIGVTSSQLRLSPAATSNLGSSAPFLISSGIGLPSSVAKSVGVRADQTVTLRSDGLLHRVHVSTVLGSQTIGAVAASPVAIALLPRAQQLTGKRGRVTNILIEAYPGAESTVMSGLRSIAGTLANVTSATNDLRLLDTAAKPNKQSTTLFAAIAGMVGLLLAVNAMLLTMPERRRLVAELRTFGYDPAQITMLVVVQALILGLIGSVIGIVFGDILSHTLFSQVPSYLAIVFPIGAQKIVTARLVLIAVGCGVLAALLASVRPLLDLRPGRAIDMVIYEHGESGQSIPMRAIAVMALTGLALIIVVTILAYAVPVLTIAGGVLLAIASVCLLPITYVIATRMLRSMGERSKGVLAVSLVELEAAATRSTALAAIAALAVYGSVAIGGARSDLTRGLETAIHQDADRAQLWITTGDNVFNTDSFAAKPIVSAVARLPDVAGIRTDQGALLTVGNRRLLIRAQSPNIPATIQASQIIRGNLERASEMIRKGGWATISDGFATEHKLRVGSHFALPAPAGELPLGVAAITTNLGWPSGAITFSTSDYLRGWRTTNSSAIEVNLKPGITPGAGRLAVQAALGSRFGVIVQTFREREIQADRYLRQGLGALGQISTLILITGAIAIAASLAAVIWQRRPRMAAMKTWGYDELQLWRSLLAECAILLGIGCAGGAVLGLYGHALADRWLRLTTDFPAPFALGGRQAVFYLALVVIIALVVVALPGFRAARVSPSVGFQE